MAMPVLHVTLTEAQRQELRAALRVAPDARTYKRMKIVELSDRGYTVQALAELFDVHEQSVRSYLHAYATGGLAALPDAPRSGRPRKLPPEYSCGGDESHAAWQRLLDRRPSTIPELRTPSHVWTLGLLARYLHVFHQVEVAESTIYVALSRAGFRRGRTKLTVTSPDPEYEVKRQRIEALGKAPGLGSSRATA
jgi:transposase